MATALNTRVTLVDQRTSVLEFADDEIVESLLYLLRRRGATLRLGERVVSARRDAQGVTAELASGKRIHADALLYAVGRHGNADRLRLGNAGLEADARGRIAVNAQFQTAVPHIYAAGDVVGFPALASVSMEQGRQAAQHMLGEADRRRGHAGAVRHLHDPRDRDGRAARAGADRPAHPLRGWRRPLRGSRQGADVWRRRGVPEAAVRSGLAAGSSART